MLFDSLASHAKLLGQGAWDDCYVISRCRVDIGELDKRLDSGGAVDLPLLTEGKVRKGRSIVAEESGVGALRQRFSFFDAYDNLPDSYSRLSFGKKAMDKESFLDLFSWINGLDGFALEVIFGKGSVFDNFTGDWDSVLKNIKKATCLPVNNKTPQFLLYLLLGFNGLVNHSSLDSYMVIKQLVEIRRFMLYQLVLFKMEKTARGDKTPFKVGNCEISGKMEVLPIGNVTLPKCHLYMRLTDDVALGEIYDFEGDPVNVIDMYKALSGSFADGSKHLKIGAKKYSFYDKGMSPTCCVSNCPEVLRKGKSGMSAGPYLGNYGRLLKGTGFKLIPKENMSFYLFPEIDELDPSGLEHYCDYLSGHNWSCREELWDNLRVLPSSKFLVALEDEVYGAAQQPVWGWTSVFRGVSAAKVFVFLSFLDTKARFDKRDDDSKEAVDCRQCGSLVNLLQNTPLGGSWAVKEYGSLVEGFFAGRSIDIEALWRRWRRCISHGETYGHEEWGRAIQFLLGIKALESLECDGELDGYGLYDKYDNLRGTLMTERMAVIKEYLSTFVWTDGDKYMDERARCYAQFIDTEGDYWTHIVNGLVCGEIIKSLCWQLRGRDYVKLVGGRSFTKQTPWDIKAWASELRERLIRANGMAVTWTDKAFELLTAYSTKDPGNEVDFFMDGFSDGFYKKGYFKKEEVA